MKIPYDPCQRSKLKPKYFDLLLPGLRLVTMFIPTNYAKWRLTLKSPPTKTTTLTALKLYVTF